MVKAKTKLIVDAEKSDKLGNKQYYADSVDAEVDVREIPSELLKGIKIKYINNYLELYNDIF